MAKSRRKKNYKLRKRVMRTVAALTMIMAIVVAAIPVENYGTMRAADSDVFQKVDEEIGNVAAHYKPADYEDKYKGSTGIVQRIRDNNGVLSLVDLFEVRKNGSNAIIVRDIIGDGTNKGETELTINQTEYCNYVQFDPDFIKAVSGSLDGKAFDLIFIQDVETTLQVPAGLNANATPIKVKTIKKDGYATNTVSPSITITGNDNAQGYDNFGSFSLDSGSMYSQDFGKALYDTKIVEIDDYNVRVNAFITKVKTFITKVSAPNYTWDSNIDANEWNGYVNEAKNFDFDSASKLSKVYTDFGNNADNGLNNIVDYIIRNHCKNGNSDLTKFRLRSLQRLDSNNNFVTVYVPQYTEAGNIEWLDENNFLPAGADSKVTIKGIASYHENSDDKAFYKTSLNKITLPQGLEFIGKQAFGTTSLTEITIDTTNCEIIGEEAFAESTYLAKVNFTFSGEVNSQKFITIDKKAFCNTAVTGVTIPAPITTIGAGAFAGVRALQTVTFEDTGRAKDIEIEKYAFYNCDGLTEVRFPEGNMHQYKIGKGAFALGNLGGKLTSFQFPGGNTSIDYGNSSGDYDYILANRDTLQNVTFPKRLGGNIPDNTLVGCKALSWVRFPDEADKATYSPDKLFAGVFNSEFYVEGPETLNGVDGTRSKPRTTTWEAKAGNSGTENDPVWALKTVPYKFTDKNGNVHFETGVNNEQGQLQYVADIKGIEGSNKASLVGYTPYDANAKVDKAWVTIPTRVGGYDIVSIEPGCFDNAEKLKNNITRLTIGDSVTDIKTGAFKGMEKLQWVDIGSGVVNIEKDAFAECTNLENVVFSQTLTSTFNEDSVEYWEQLKIAPDAFKTNSKRMTFHGAVNPNYAPFKLAMSADNSQLLDGGAQICYKTDAPLNLTIIRNRKDGKATLVDYPHYEDMSDDVRGQFEQIYIDGKEGEMTTDDQNQILQTLKMVIPSGIESVDAKSFFANDAGNEKDYDYVDHHYQHVYGPSGSGTSSDSSDHQWTNAPDREFETGDSTKKDIKKLYSEDAYIEDPNYADSIGDTAYVEDNPDGKMEVSTGGLFSGNFKESKAAIQTDSVIWKNPYEGHTYVEEYISGNDYLTSINMRGVKELPAYTFDSCENLLTVTFNAVESMGDLPFRGCKNLNKIDTGATKYVFENLLLYETKADGSMEIVQCLEGRGKGFEYFTGSVTSSGEEGASNVDAMLSNVTSIRQGAFSNCERITLVNLEDSGVEKIPRRAFENCKSLDEVILPKTIRAIDQKAFMGAAEQRNLKVTIKDPDCTIAVDAFDFKTTSEVFIRGISTNYKGEKSICYRNYEQIKEELKKKGIDENRIHWIDEGSTYILTFEDGDTGALIKTVEIEKGATLENPPTAPEKNGKKFDYWLCTQVKDENGNPLMGEATYSNVQEDRTIRAIYKDDPNTVIPDGKDYNLTVANGKAIIGGMPVSTFPTTVKGGTPVAIIANDESNFKVWTIEPGTYISLLTDASKYMTTFNMPNADITVTANSAIGGGTDTPNPDGTYKVTVNNGTGSGNYRPGATVTITANTPPAGQTFVNWTTTTADVKFASATTATTTFVMPAANVNVTANFSGGNGGNNNPGGDGNNPGGSDSGKKYKVTVNYGSGSGEYAAGATVNITANAPESSSRVFSRWTTNNSGLGFANANSVSTSFVMPAADVTVTANYKTRSSDDDDDDDDGPSRRPGTNTSTSTVPNRPSSSTSTTGTNGTVNNPASGTTTNNNGNRIYITKNGISNTDVASLAVSGSTDNFIVRITESPEATAAVEQSLTNTYGSLNGLAYLPMDISLYDSTGQNKITDSTGLNITVTMPIPDVLIQYGGNARVAAADNGNLQQITPRFTTIDGIACVSFVPPHFSPYVIYVDTNNLIAGQMLDATPATGDPIHPKWFAAIGMACASILMFVLSDGRKRRKYRAA